MTVGDEAVLCRRLSPMPVRAGDLAAQLQEGGAFDFLAEEPGMGVPTGRCRVRPNLRVSVALPAALGQSMSGARRDEKCGYERLEQ